MNLIMTYINESLEELRLVQWPTQQQAIRLTVIVVGFIFANAIVFGLLDSALLSVFRLALRA